MGFREDVKKMKALNTEKNEPFVRVAKRGVIPFWQSLLIRIAAIAAALLLCGLITMILVGRSPFDLYRTMWTGAFGTTRKVWKLVKDLAILLSISLAVTPAFRMRFWNIGGEGQVLVGCLATTACMYYFGGKIADGVLLPIMLVSALLAGAVWGAIPAVFKAKWKTNETLFTLMMNYIAIYLVEHFLSKWTPNHSSTLPRLEYGHLPTIYNQYLLIIIIVVILTALMFVYLNYSKHGYEISVVGESENTARYIGINVPKVIIRTMILSGLLCGLTGFLIVSGLDHSITSNSAGGQGFTAIMASWMAKFNPFTMIVTSFLIVFLNQGGAQISQEFNMSDAFPSMITGIILFFVIGCEFFIQYRLVFRNRGKKEEESK